MVLKKNKLHLLYERNKYNDVLVDSYGQLCFPFMSKCRYDVPIEEIGQPRFKAHTFDGIEVYHYSDTIKYKKDGVLIDGKLVPFDTVVAYTGVVDINGKPIYTKDFVRTDEIGWCGFVFMAREGAICIESPSGFSTNPSNIERIGNPIIGDYEADAQVPHNFFDLLEEKYKDFMNNNRILMNWIGYNSYGLDIK